jgi:O-antigen/teichoic acid export membrane protein
MARYRQNFLLIYTLTLLGVMPLAFWVGAEWSGAMGVAIGWLTVYPILLMWMAREALREIQVSWQGLVRHLSLPTATTLIMVATLLTSRWLFFSYENPSSKLRLLAIIALGATAYGGGFLAFGGPVRSEMFEVVGWLFRKHQATPVPR